MVRMNKTLNVAIIGLGQVGIFLYNELGLSCPIFGPKSCPNLAQLLPNAWPEVF